MSSGSKIISIGEEKEEEKGGVNEIWKTMAMNVENEGKRIKKIIDFS